MPESTDMVLLAESLKIKVGNLEAVTVESGHVFGQEDLRELCRPMFERLVQEMASVLEGYGRKPDTLLLTGGSAKLPALAEAVREVAGCRVVVQEDPQHTTARGAAILGRRRFEKSQVRIIFSGDYVTTQLPSAGQISDLPLDIEGVLRAHLDTASFAARNASPEIRDRMFRRTLGGEESVQRLTGEGLLIDADLGSMPGLQEGEMLGPFSLLRRLGKGFFAEVWLANDATSDLGRLVALKIPFRQDELGARRLREEAERWRHLCSSGHPNILYLEDLKSVDGKRFFVMEYMKDGNLADAVRDKEPGQRVQLVRQWLEQLCLGLAFLHEHKTGRHGSRPIIHGDIKPQNILLSDGLAKLADFGLTAPLAEKSRGLAGTKMFMAPESFDGIQSQQTDVYALGVTLFYLLTGSYPFPQGKTGTISVRSHPLEEEEIGRLKAERAAFRPNLRRASPLVPPSLADLVERCLEADPARRFQDGGELAEFIRPKHVVLTVNWNFDNPRAVYGLECLGRSEVGQMERDLPHPVIEGMYQKWDKLGLLALERAIPPDERRDLKLIDQEIRLLLERIADDGTGFVVAEKIRALMHDWDIASLYLLHEAGLAALPWELFRTGSKTWARSFPMARHPILREPPKRRFYRRRRGDKLRLVIVRDDSGDLPETISEARRIREELQHLSEEIEIEEFGQQDNSMDVRSSIKRCQILHFAGHVIFPEESSDLSSSGWLLKGNPAKRSEAWDLLHPDELRQFWKDAPLLVFANGCQSAAAKPPQRANSQGAVDLAEACLSAGVSAYIGAVWKAPDNVPTGEFAAIFYRLFATGLTASEAMLAARDEIARKFGEEDLTWARYVVCGDPFLRLPLDAR